MIPITTPLAAKIIDAGLVANEYHLDLNRCIEDPAPRYPRSRLFKFPISYDQDEDRLTVTSTFMMMEPFVMDVATRLGEVVAIDPEPRGCHGTYHHAVDLAYDDCFRDLLATRIFTTDRAILRGVTIGAQGARLSTANAREILDTIGAVETPDRSAFNLSFAGGMLHPSFIDDGTMNGKKTGKGHYAINLFSRRDPVGEAWAMIHGIEDGWFKKKKPYGYHSMSDAGMRRHIAL